MNTKRKTAGFFIVEILIVLLIVGILALALLPNLQLYTQKAKFRDNIAAAAALKPAVEMCILKNLATYTTVCVSGSEGIPNAITTNYSLSGTDTGNVASAQVVAGPEIQVVSTPKFGDNGATAYNYTLVPTASADGVVTWTVSSAAIGTNDSCTTKGLC